MTARLIAIGDIHGEVHKLNKLIDKLSLKQDDTVVFLGDYVDRGYHSRDVINQLLKLSKFCHCEFFLGNHEFNLLKAKQVDSYAMDFFMTYGGVQTIDSYGSFDNIFKEHANFFKSLKPYYLTKDYLFVHAGVRPDKQLEEQEIEDLLFIRDNFIYNEPIIEQKVVFGHTPFETPMIEKDKIGIDTGCGKEPDAPLTAFICYSEKIVQAK